MSKNWTKIAKQEFDNMPREYKADWADLRKQVMLNVRA